MPGPISVDSSGSLPKVSLEIISSAKNTLLANSEFATFQLTKRDIDFAAMFDPMFLKDILATGGYFYLSAPRKAYVKLSAPAIAEAGSLVEGTRYVWLENADATDKIGLIGDGWRKESFSKSDFSIYKDMFGTQGVKYSVYVNDNVGGKSPVGIVVAEAAEITLGDSDTTDGSLDITTIFGMYENPSASVAEIITQMADMGFGESTMLELADDPSSPDTVNMSSETDAIFADAGAGNDIITTGSGGDTLLGGQGSDTLSAGSGKDFITGGSGNDLIDGGANGSDGSGVYDTGDEVNYNGASTDYTITKLVDDGSGTVTGTGNQIYFTVVDNVGTDGTDTVYNVELMHFDKDYVTKILVPEIDIWRAGSDILGSNQRGTDFDDILTGTDAYDRIEGSLGNDILLGEASGSAGAGDELIGGGGNDFVDGVRSGNTNSPWENDNRSFFNAAQSRYTIEAKTLAEIKTLLADASDSLTFNTALTGSYMDSNYSNSDTFTLVTDSLTALQGGTGVDILVNIQEIGFNDGPYRLGEMVIPESRGGSVVSKFIEGTAQADAISRASETVNLNIEAKAGSDIILSGGGSDRINPSKGNDFVDGGASTNSDNQQEWRIADELVFRGDFKNFTVSELTKAELATLITYATDGDASTSGIALNAALDISGYSNSQKFFRVTDLNTKASGLGDNIVTNIERVSFDDGYKNLAVAVDVRNENWDGFEFTEASWFGTFADDTMNASTLQTYSGSYPDPSNAANKIRDNLDGGVGDDTLFGDKFGDYLKGGVGNDILDGGDAGALSAFSSHPWMTWMANDEASYDGNFGRYEISLFNVPASGTMVIKDIFGVNTYTINSSREVFRHDASGTVDGSASHTFASGTTQFFSITDTLPATFGGEGTDIVTNITELRFLDKNFSLSTSYESYQGGEGKEQFSRGTTFDDIIDLTSTYAVQTATTITSNITNSATTIPIASSMGLPFGGYIKIGSEEIYYTGIDGNNLTGAIRAALGTSAAAHSANAAATSDGRNNVEPGNGNDIVKGGGGKDRIEGSIGNDFIDGGANKTPPSGDFNTWKYNDEVSYSGPIDRYTLSTVTTSELSALISGGLVLNSGVDLTASAYNNHIFIKVVDALADVAGGEGTDFLINVEELGFNDDHVSLATRAETRLENFGGSDVTRGFLEGTFQSETLEWNAGANGSVDFVEIRAGKGNDLLLGTTGADRFEPQAGNDTIDGKADDISSYSSGGLFEYVDTVRFAGDPQRFTASKANVKFDSDNKAVFLNDVDADSNGVWDNTSIVKEGEFKSVAPNYADTASSAGGSYEAAFIVTDSLSPGKGGLGINVIQNVELFEFGDGSNWKSLVTILEKSIETRSDTGSGRHNEVASEDSNGLGSTGGNVTLHKIKGTAFNDTIDVDTELAATKFVKVEGSKGNDTIVGASSNYTTLRYDGDKSEFTITPNYSGSSLTNITVRHNSTASDGGYGTDTISKIEEIQFINGEISLDPELKLEGNNASSSDREDVRGTLLNDTITVSTNANNLEAYASAGSDTYTGSTNGSTGDSWENDTVRYDKLYYLNELTLEKNGSNVLVTKPDGSVDTLINIDWIRTKGESGSIKTSLDTYVRNSNEHRGSIFSDTNSVNDTNITRAKLYGGDDTYTFAGTGSWNYAAKSGTWDYQKVYPGLGNDTVTFTGDGTYVVRFEGSYERYDVSFWDGSSVVGGNKVLDKTFNVGDKVVVTDNLVLSSGGTGQDVITAGTNITFSNGWQDLNLQIWAPDPDDADADDIIMFNLYDGNNHELGTGATYDPSSPSIGFVDFMNVHVDTNTDTRNLTNTVSTIVGLGKQGFTSDPTYVSGIQADLREAADISVLQGYLQSDWGITDRFLQSIDWIASDYAGYDVYGTTGNDVITGTTKVDWFYGDQGNDTYFGGGSPNPVSTTNANGQTSYTLGPWDASDVVRYQAPLSRYELNQLIDTSGSITGTAGKTYISVQDKISRDGLGDGVAAGNKVFGTGLDTLIDIGTIKFSDAEVITTTQTETHTWNAGRDLNSDGSNDSITNYEYRGSQFSDTIEVDTAAHNRIKASAGNDTITGKANYSNLPLATQIAVGNDYWAFAEIVQYSAAQDYFTITVNSDGTLTVADSRTGIGSYGTDTISGIDILEFESGDNWSQYALAPTFQSDSFSGSLTLTVNSSSGFTVGESVTGGTSNKTSMIVSIPNSTTISVEPLASGDFTDTETLTGGSSALTATMASSVLQTVTFLRVSDPGINNNYSTLDLGSYTSIEYQDGGGSDQYYGVKTAANSAREGDVVFYNGAQDSFNVTIEPDDASGNTVVKVEDFRGATTVTDTLFNIEQIRFYSESGGRDSGVDLLPTFEDFNSNQAGNDYFRGTNFDDVIVADAGRNDIQGQAGNDNLIGNVGGDSFQPGAGHDFMDGVAATSTSSDNQWETRNDAYFSVASDRVAITNVMIELENIGTSNSPINVATRNADGTFKTYTTGSAPSGAVSAVYIVDALEANSGDSLGSNVLYNVDSVGFSDGQWFEFSGFTDERDFDGDGIIDEVFKEGTPFADTMTGSAGNDFMDGRENDDNLIGGAGGDILTGGAGNDIINGGADGTSGDPWRDMDVAEYNGIQSRYSISSKTNDVDSNSNNIWDNTLIAKSGDYASTAPVYYTVTDSLTGDLGGTGVDKLTGIESIRFSDAEVELGLRIQSFDFDGDGTIDFTEINGTSAADTINPTDFSLGGDDEIRGKGGNDIISAGPGGDRITGGGGDDKIDGGANGTSDGGGYVPKDEAIYQASSSRFTVSDAQSDSNGSITGISGQVYYTVADTLPSNLGGFGTDTIWNVEFLSFVDDFMPLGVETFINYDGNNNEIGRFVNGTRSGETLKGASGSDDLNGRGGNDIIYGGAGSDFIQGGKGDDTIYGGDNGVDENGNVMGDTVMYRGNYADYEITDGTATVDGISVTSIKVSHTDASGDGEDTLYNVENLQFDDKYIRIGTEVFTNYDEDGVAISANHRGSILSDTITGTSISDYIEGDAGADILSGGSGADYLIGGTGNDTLDGGADGLDPWGNPGEDVASYNGVSTNYTITHYTSAGSAVSSYQKTGYFTVKDSITDAQGGEGTDTLKKIERVDFSDKSISFAVNNSFVDLDGDGFPDMGSFKGTAGADVIEGTNLDEMFDGNEGNDYILAGAGGDILIGGTGNDTLVGAADGEADSFGRSRSDVAEVNMNIASIVANTFTTVYVAADSLGVYQSEATSVGSSTYDGIFAIEVYAASADVPNTHTAGSAIVLKNGSERDLLVGIEGVEFTDGFVSLATESRDIDTDGDGLADKQFKRGTGIADTLSSGDTDDDIDLGPGNDKVDSGAGNDFIMVGSGTDTVVAGAGNDVVEINGDFSSAITAYLAESNSTAGSYTLDDSNNATGWNTYSGKFTYEVYQNSSDVTGDFTAKAVKIATDGSDANLLIDVEGIQYNDKFVQLVSRETLIDVDGDGTSDTVVKVDGSDNSLAPSSGKEALAHVLDGGDGADVLTGGTAGDVLIGGAGADLIKGGTNIGTGADGNPSADVAVYFGTSVATTSSAATYTVTQVYAIENSNGSAAASSATNFYTSQSAATSALSSGQRVVNAFTVSDGTDTDLLVGVEKIEFTDGVVQAAPTRSTFTTTTIANGEEEITTIDGSPYADTITSTTGSETFIGNGGLDKFVFVANSGVDKILDFTIAGTDTTGDGTVDSFEKISLTRDDATNSIGINGTSITSASSVLQRITSSSDGALIDLGSNNSITLIGITASDLTASHFEIL